MSIYYFLEAYIGGDLNEKILNELLVTGERLDFIYYSDSGFENIVSVSSAVAKILSKNDEDGAPPHVFVKIEDTCVQLFFKTIASKQVITLMPFADVWEKNSAGTRVYSVDLVRYMRVFLKFLKSCDLRELKLVTM